MASHFSVRAVAVSTVFVWSLAYAVTCAAQAPASPQLDAQRRVTVVFQGSKHVLRGRLVGRDANTLVIELDNPDVDRAEDGARTIERGSQLHKLRNDLGVVHGRNKRVIKNRSYYVRTCLVVQHGQEG